MMKVAMKADRRKKRSLNKNQWTMKTMLTEVRIIRTRMQRHDEHDVIPGFLTAGTLFLRALTGTELGWMLWNFRAVLRGFLTNGDEFHFGVVKSSHDAQGKSPFS